MCVCDVFVQKHLSAIFAFVSLQSFCPVMYGFQIQKPYIMIEKHQPLLSLPPTLGPGIINRESWRLDGNANTSGYLRLGISASGVGDNPPDGEKYI